MQIEILEVAGLVTSMLAMRLPKGSKSKTDNGTGYPQTYYNVDTCCFDIETSTFKVVDCQDLTLAKKLILAGDAHAKAIRGIVAYFKITAPIYWWRELETHRAGHERLSCESTMHIDCKGLTGEELQRAKAEMPMGKEQTAIDYFSYQTLRNIWLLRRHHRLPEWHEFIVALKNLPFADELIFVEHESK